MVWLRDNGLTLVLLAATVLTISGMAISGDIAHNKELAEHGATALNMSEYLISGSFISALFENWESEFLQMGFYVVLTAYLFQKGSAESRDPDGGDEEADREEPLHDRGRLGLFGTWLYSYSLGIVLGLLFLSSFLLHLFGSQTAANDEALLHHQPTETLLAYLGDAQFWFESLQNWQSEFLATALLVVLSIFLRFRRSPESKSVNAGTDETGA